MSKKILLVAVVAGLMLAAMIQPAPAVHITGVVSTGCTTRLIDFPNSTDLKNDDDCDNDANGAMPTGGPIDYALGVINTPAGVWAGGGPGATRVSFTYNENCTGVPNGVFPLVGAAKGNFVVGGTLNGAPARLIAGFTWSRQGLVAIIGFGNTISGHNLDDGTLVGAGLFGFDTNNNATNVEISAAGVTAAAVGLLQPRGGSGAHGSPINNCPDDDGAGQWEVVTAYSVGVLGSAA